MIVPDGRLARRVEQVVSWQFPAARVAGVLALLREQLGGLQAQAGRPDDDFERVLLADLKLAAGNEAALARGLAEALIDWRDTLMAAGFGEDLAAHDRWFDQLRARHEAAN